LIDFWEKKNVDLLQKVSENKPLDLNQCEEIVNDKFQSLNENSTPDEVQKWFQTFEGGKFSHLADCFKSDDGSDVFGYSEDQFTKKFSKKLVNEAEDWAMKLHNVLHPKNQ